MDMVVFVFHLHNFWQAQGLLESTFGGWWVELAHFLIHKAGHQNIYIPH